MANELNIQLDPFNQTGLVLLGKVFDKNGTQQGTSVTLTENAPALYSGDFSLSSVSDGAYLVRFETNLPDELYGTGALYVRNNAEVSQENFFNATLDEVITDAASRNASKADLSGIETKTEADSRQVILINEHNQTHTDISNLNDFDPSNDDVAKVNLVDVTTTNLDMRGTDNANTTTPPTVSEIDTELTVTHGSGSWQQASSGGTVDANIISVDGNNVTGVDDFKANVSNLSTFDPSSDEVTTDSVSREASKADTTSLGTKDNQEVINDGVKKSSLIIPHTDNLPD